MNSLMSALGRSRTFNLTLKRRLLYLIELRGHGYLHAQVPIFWRYYSNFIERTSVADGHNYPARLATLFFGERGIRTPTVQTHADFTGRLPDQSGDLSVVSCLACPRDVVFRARLRCP
jgi:hypothetical protein